jgi:hypothetical protein
LFFTVWCQVEYIKIACKWVFAYTNGWFFHSFFLYGLFFCSHWQIFFIYCNYTIFVLFSASSTLKLGKNMILFTHVYRFRKGHWRVYWGTFFSCFLFSRWGRL